MYRLLNEMPKQVRHDGKKKIHHPGAQRPPRVGFGRKSCGGAVRYRLRSKLLQGKGSCDKKAFPRLDFWLLFIKEK
jgi:hypothetical protein